jgi:hypothetical protein
MGSASDEKSFRKVVLNDTHPGRFFQNNSGLTSASINVSPCVILESEDYDLKVSMITLAFLK